MNKLFIIITILLLAGCVKQVPIEDKLQPSNPQVREPSTGPSRFIDQEMGVVCYWRRQYEGISCVRMEGSK